MVIGIYGGSFDPIHTGHAIVANFVAQCGVVDEVWLTVSRRNPLKPQSTVAGEEQRAAMARIVARKCKNVRVSEIEFQLPTPSYTIDTLRELRRIHPEHEFRIIIGSDSLEGFHRWKESDAIRKEFGVIVYPRPGYPLRGEEPGGIKYLTGAPEFSVSSSLIREYVASGWDINYFVPTDVCEYITENKLYR